MPFLLHTKTDTLTEETASNDYLKWLEDDDPAEQEERQALHVLQNAGAFSTRDEQHFEPHG